MIGLAALFLKGSLGAGVAHGALPTVAKAGAKAIGKISSARKVGMTAAGLGLAGNSLLGSDLLSGYYYGVHGISDSSIESFNIMQTASSVATTALIAGGAYKTVVGERRPGGWLKKRGTQVGTQAVKMSASTASAVSKSAKKSAGVLSNFISKTDLKFGVAGLGLGATFGIGENIMNSGPVGAPEGNIRAIRSSRTGGIDPALQYSTHGLNFALHNKRKRVF